MNKLSKKGRLSSEEALLGKKIYTEFFFDDLDGIHSSVWYNHKDHALTPPAVWSALIALHLGTRSLTDIILFPKESYADAIITHYHGTLIDPVTMEMGENHEDGRNYNRYAHHKSANILSQQGIDVSENYVTGLWPEAVTNLPTISLDLKPKIEFPFFFKKRERFLDQREDILDLLLKILMSSDSNNNLQHFGLNYLPIYPILDIALILLPLTHNSCIKWLNNAFKKIILNRISGKINEISEKQDKFSTSKEGSDYFNKMARQMCSLIANIIMLHYSPNFMENLDDYAVKSQVSSIISIKDIDATRFDIAVKRLLSISVQIAYNCNGVINQCYIDTDYIIDYKGNNRGFRPNFVIKSLNTRY